MGSLADDTRWMDATAQADLVSSGQATPLELTDAAGKKTLVMTDKDTRWANGPVIAQGMYHGEDYDARLADPDWCRPDVESRWRWQPVELQGSRAVSMTARLSPPVRTWTGACRYSRRRIRRR